MRPFRHRLFTLWFGIGFPLILAGTLYIAFDRHTLLGVAVLAVLMAWFYETGRTTCSRCAHFGTAKCGLPGLIAPLLTHRRSPATVSRARIRSHFHLDLCILILLNGVYLLEPWWLPVMVVWSLGAWCISLGPKRYHGLLHRLRRREERDTEARADAQVIVWKDRPRGRSAAA